MLQLMKSQRVGHDLKDRTAITSAKKKKQNEREGNSELEMEVRCNMLCGWRKNDQVTVYWGHKQSDTTEHNRSFLISLPIMVTMSWTAHPSSYFIINSMSSATI